MNMFKKWEPILESIGIDEKWWYITTKYIEKYTSECEYDDMLLPPNIRAFSLIDLENKKIEFIGPEKVENIIISIKFDKSEINTLNIPLPSNIISHYEDLLFKELSNNINSGNTILIYRLVDKISIEKDIDDVYIRLFSRIKVI